MIKSIYADADTTIYEKTGSMNTGLDPVLELHKVSSSAGVFNSRVLIKFPLSSISSSILSGDIINPKYYLNLYQTSTREVPLQYTLIAYPISQSWVTGTGKKIDPVSINQFTKAGSSWTYRNKEHPTTEFISARDVQWTSRSLNNDGSTPDSVLTAGSTMVYSSVTGGGTWYHEAYGSQSFNHESADLRMDITPVVNYLIGTGSNYTGVSKMKINGENDGFILLRSGSQETGVEPYGANSFFSRETNTVYQPRLEVVYDDSSFNSAGLTELSSDQSVVYLKNLKHEYSQKETPKLRIVGRDRYPVKTFATSSNYKTIKFLPTSSYYSVKDAITEEFIIPYSNLGTKLSCDSDGNFIKLEMSSFMPERYYKMCFQVTQSDSSVVIYDENFYFRVNR